MYLFPTPRWDNNDGQHIGRGWFLLLMMPELQSGELITDFLKCKDVPHALVRKVALVQCGQWMMGTAHVLDHHLTISGDYGGDGLPMSVPKEVYDLCVPLPDDLYQLWSHDTTGWNTAGESGIPIRKWAIEHLEELIPVRCRFPKTRQWGCFKLELDHVKINAGYYRTRDQGSLQTRLWFERRTNLRESILCMGEWN